MARGRKTEEIWNMSTLIVIAFKDKLKAEEVLLELKKLEKEYVVDLEDAAIVTKDDEGQIKIKQTHNLTLSGAVGGGFWGGLIGILFLNPLLGFALGAGAGALTGSLSDYGIPDDFIKELGGTIDKGNSALFFLLRSVTVDKLLDDLDQFEGIVLKTSLSKENEDRLREALAAHH